MLNERFHLVVSIISQYYGNFGIEWYVIWPKHAMTISVIWFSFKQQKNDAWFDFFSVSRTRKKKSVETYSRVSVTIDFRIEVCNERYFFYLVHFIKWFVRWLSPGTNSVFVFAAFPNTFLNFYHVGLIACVDNYSGTIQ